MEFELFRAEKDGELAFLGDCNSRSKITVWQLVTVSVLNMDLQVRPGWNGS